MEVKRTASPDIMQQVHKARSSVRSYRTIGERESLLETRGKHMNKRKIGTATQPDPAEIIIIIIFLPKYKNK